MHSKSQPRTAARSGPALAPVEDLLVLADGSAAAAKALAYAEALAPDGNVTALMFGLMPGYPVSEFSGEAWLIARRDAETAAERAEAAFTETLARHGSRAELRRADVIAGEEGRVMAAQARYVDAVIFGWPTAEAARPVREFEAVLFNAGRPSILVPETCALRGQPRRIMVAWSPTREASRAIHDALPLLAAAEQVGVVVVASEWDILEPNPGDDMARHLARHDIAVEVKNVPTGGRLVASVLLDEARFQGAELIVMGGYSHSRTGEWLFGGVTRDMLGALSVPVMMSH
ncbi:MAG: universal stress protein [Beijerinckiaceae bacterium]|jgi:nucleotide-binding universal stress UspA family protein|nr:universal stress protein [Beijerinckiaceae bacterium]